MKVTLVGNTLLGNTVAPTHIKEDRMPKSAFYTLTWSASSQAYELYGGKEDGVMEPVPDSPALSVWVSRLSSFAFHGQNGSYTARKEHKGRDGEYWYAYARVEGKLTKRYLGRSSDLTLPRLEQVVQELKYHRSHFDRLSTGARHRARRDSSIGWRNIEHESSVGGRKARVSTVISGLPTGTPLASKLHVPRPRPHLVHRSRLIQRLEQGLERTLILLSAPAGFGKSTLLADWLAARAMPAAWLSLEPRDNDLARFLSSLLAALQTCDPQLGASEKALLHPLQPAALESVLTMLINGLQARMTGDQEHVVLVLDNYHVITNTSIHHALCFLLAHLPAHLHLVLASRQDPPLPLAALRGRGDLLELRAADLRFTPQETATFLTGVMGLPLPAQQRALLHARTEGWITGLQLAACSLQGCADPAGFIATFSGNHRSVMDYLLDEVLSRQGAAVQAFLLHTSILDRLSAPLCDAVRGQQDSQALLALLEQANLFLVPLDDDGQWYRYHQLFAQALRQRLQQTAPTLVAQLHLRASDWHEQHGLFSEAVCHALAASAFEDAARLLEQALWPIVLDQQLQALCGWLQALPEALVLAQPALWLMQALALLETTHGAGALAEDTPAAQDRLLLDQVVACRSLLAWRSQALPLGLAPGSRAQRLAAAERAGPQLPVQAAPAPALVEPLTARERDVLRLVLLDGASNREIARRLVLSVNTVKKHIANLYGKLHVQSRAQAIAKAHLLQLL